MQKKAQDILPGIFLWKNPVRAMRGALLDAFAFMVVMKSSIAVQNRTPVFSPVDTLPADQRHRFMDMRL